MMSLSVRNKLRRYIHARRQHSLCKLHLGAVSAALQCITAHLTSPSTEFAAFLDLAQCLLGCMYK
ncbi:hypothetical protein [Pantoea rwandensis]|uniref:hypothetical protein n=1 Tax=Pantoea rwandensis TaxID=1076550 RepID=UPI00111C16F6|nr:hypothetical protein [Pantoea rwandensis]